MPKFLQIILLILLTGGFLILFLGFLVTWRNNHSIDQKKFFQGSLLGMIPDGAYKGSVNFYKASWIGKRFDRENNTGLNLFGSAQAPEERYPFVTRIEKGVHDADLDVLVLDYNLSENPWWLRRIRDEIVEVSSGKYLGKVFLRVFPGYPFTIGFFELER
ncbi:MAG: hypothetical protein AAB408_03470 [Patescibacteria group bacterium]